MKRRIPALAAVAMASTVAMAAAGMAQAHMSQGQGQGQMEKSDKSHPGRGMMDQGKGRGPMKQGQMGQGHMMGHMMGQGHMMGFKSGFRREKPLSNDEARRVVDGRLALGGLSRLKAGSAKDADKDAVEIDVVTEKGDLVYRLKVNRTTGRAVIIE